MIPLGSRARNSSIHLLLAACLATAFASDARADIDVTQLGLHKIVERPDGGAPSHRFIACAEGTGIASTGSTLTVSGASPVDLVQVSATEHCFVDFTGSLDATYPSTGETYTFDLAAAEGDPGSYATTFTATAPATYPNILEPAHSDSVLEDRDLLVRWEHDSDPCGPTCQGFVVDLIEGAATIHESGPLSDATFSTEVPQTALAAEGQYLLSVETYNGSWQDDAATGEDTYKLDRVYRSANRITLFGTARTLDVDFLELVKGTTRVNGNIIAQIRPYFFQGCVGATGLSGNPSLRPESGPDIPLLPEEDAEDEWCTVEENFISEAALDAAYPHGDTVYLFILDQTTGSVQIPVSFADAAPEAYVDYSNPSNGAGVPENRNLTVRWALDKGESGCSTPGSCSDGIAFVAEKRDVSGGGGEIIAEEILPATTTQQTIPADDLIEGRLYDLLLGTFKGEVDAPRMDGTVDDYEVTHAIVDENAIGFEVVPEPGAAALQAAALASVAWLLRRRRRSHV